MDSINFRSCAGTFYSMENLKKSSANAVYFAVSSDDTGHSASGDSVTETEED